MVVTLKSVCANIVQLFFHGSSVQVLLAAINDAKHSRTLENYCKLSVQLWQFLADSCDYPRTICCAVFRHNQNGGCANKYLHMLDCNKRVIIFTVLIFKK